MLNKSPKKGSRRVKFGDVVRQVKDKVDPKISGLERYIAGEHMDSDDLRIRRWGEISKNYLGPAFHMRFKSGQVLYGSRRTYLRKVAVPDFEGICANTTYVLESKDPAILLPELLPFIMQTETFHEHSIKQSKGSVNPYINFSDIAWYEFALPPLEEQRRIVEVMSRFELLSKNLQAAIAAARRSLYAIATNLLYQNLIRPLFLKQEVYFPEGWSIACFEEVTERITYGFTNPMPTTDDGPWMVTAKDIRDGYIDYGTARHTSQSAFLEDLTNKSRPRKDDILITKDGTLGRVAIVDQEEVCINQSVATLRPNGKAIPEFIAWSLRAPVMQWRLMLDVGGSAVQHLYITRIARTQFLLPSLQTQTEIVFILGKAEKVYFAVNSRLESTQHLKSVQLNKLLGDAEPVTRPDKGILA